MFTCFLFPSFFGAGKGRSPWEPKSNCVAWESKEMLHVCPYRQQGTKIQHVWVATRRRVCGFKSDTPPIEGRLSEYTPPSILTLTSEWDRLLPPSRNNTRHAYGGIAFSASDTFLTPPYVVSRFAGEYACAVSAGYTNVRMIRICTGNTM